MMILMRDKDELDLKKVLLDLKETPLTFGEMENPIKFFRNQLFMQINKFRNKQA